MEEWGACPQLHDYLCSQNGKTVRADTQAEQTRPDETRTAHNSPDQPSPVQPSPGSQLTVACVVLDNNSKMLTSSLPNIQAHNSRIFYSYFAFFFFYTHIYIHIYIKYKFIFIHRQSSVWLGVGKMMTTHL